MRSSFSCRITLSLDSRITAHVSTFIISNMSTGETGFKEMSKETSGQCGTCEAPGEKTKISSHLMGMGQSMLQSFKPLNNICQHVCGLHCYDGDMNRQVIAHHYCSHLNEDVRQCVIYDSPDTHAKLIGVEYIISANLYETLPQDEKKYWHSHAYEVKSGMLIAPSIPEKVERMEMEKLVNTYGKTWHLWQVDRGDPLPFGQANLMMAFTHDGQANPALLAEKDKITGVASLERAKARSQIPYPTILPGADQGLKNGYSR